jgi:hypothetical protein
MVKHIVLFKLKDTLSSEEKMQVMTSFKQAIEALPAQISVIRSIEVGFNINPAEAWDIALYSEFDSLADVQAYAVHPNHVAVAQIIIPYVKSRACTDYEM